MTQEIFLEIQFLYKGGVKVEFYNLSVRRIRKDNSKYLDVPLSHISYLIVFKYVVM